MFFGFPTPFLFLTAEVNDESIGTCDYRKWKAGRPTQGHGRRFPFSSYLYFLTFRSKHCFMGFLFRPPPLKSKSKTHLEYLFRFRVWDSLCLKEPIAGFQTLGCPLGSAEGATQPRTRGLRKSHLRMFVSLLCQTQIPDFWGLWHFFFSVGGGGAPTHTRRGQG